MSPIAPPCAIRFHLMFPNPFNHLRLSFQHFLCNLLMLVPVFKFLPRLPHHEQIIIFTRIVRRNRLCMTFAETLKERQSSMCLPADHTDHFNPNSFILNAEIDLNTFSMVLFDPRMVPLAW